MKKAIGALLSGLLLSGVVAAVYEIYRRHTSGQQQRSPVPDTAGARRPRRERRQHFGGGLLDLNACTLNDLLGLAGMDQDSAARIVEARPYRNKLDLVSRMVVPEAIYVQFCQFVTVSDSDKPVKTA